MADNTSQSDKVDAKTSLKRSYRQLYDLGMIDKEQYETMIRLIDKDDEESAKEPESEQK